jgi:hypothetical protein
MSDTSDPSLEAQLRRNQSSDNRFYFGCVTALLIFFVLGFVPLAILYPLTDSAIVANFALALFYFGVAVVALGFRKKAEPQTMRRATATWLVVIAGGFAPVFALLSLSNAGYF